MRPGPCSSWALLPPRSIICAGPTSAQLDRTGMMLNDARGSMQASDMAEDVTPHQHVGSHPDG